MSITVYQIQAADLLLSGLGISPEEYVIAKKDSIAFKEAEEETASPYLSRKEAANLLRCSTDTVDDLVSAGKIRASKLSAARCGRVLVDRKSLLAFVRRNTNSFKQEADNGRH